MKTYTGWEWLLIDAANQFGLDKLTFEERIQWATDNLNKLELLTAEAEKKTLPLYRKAVMAIRKAQQNIPTGHLVGVDATCSGIQIMSVLTGCTAGARATGLVDPNRRADAYTDTTEAMNVILGGGLTVSRNDAKKALMTSFYGSKLQPKNIFGEDTKELAAFYEAAQQVAPGAWELLQDLLASWQPFALEHAWKMPDGFDVRVKVMERQETRIEVDELNHASFTYEYYENVGTPKGKSNVANVTHSVDAYVLREMHRRCNYDREVVERAARLITAELIARTMGKQADRPEGKIEYYTTQYYRSTVASAVILPYIDLDTVSMLETEHLEALNQMAYGMLQYQPFELVTVHDEFKAHANNINWVRWQYKEILAELADSYLLDDIMSQIHGIPGQFNKLSNNLADLIRDSNYALC